LLVQELIFQNQRKTALASRKSIPESVKSRKWLPSHVTVHQMVGIFAEFLFGFPGQVAYHFFVPANALVKTHASRAA
jgi:hypothetical protein